MRWTGRVVAGAAALAVGSLSGGQVLDALAGWPAVAGYLAVGTGAGVLAWFGVERLALGRARAGAPPSGSRSPG